MTVSNARLAQGITIVRIVTGLLFWQHGISKIFGFAGLRPEPDLLGMRGIGGMIEIVAAPLIALGLFTRPVAFIVCGEMAVAYFRSWAPRGFFPIANNGEEAVVFCYTFLWLWAAGSGPWSLDAVIARARGRVSESLITAWEPQVRSIVRVVFGFLLTLHGCRKLFGVLPATFGRRVVPPLAFDGLPSWTGYIDLVGGALMMLGLFVRQTAAVIAAEMVLGFVLVGAPRGLWPIQNRSNETLIYAATMICFSMAGAGAWAFDRWRRRTATPHFEAVKSTA